MLLLLIYHYFGLVSTFIHYPSPLYCLLAIVTLLVLIVILAGGLSESSTYHA